eukprot:12803728-Alexandrium_andersonii.AAC.1
MCIRDSPAPDAAEGPCLAPSIVRLAELIEDRREWLEALGLERRSEERGRPVGPRAARAVQLLLSLAAAPGPPIGAP